MKNGGYGHVGCNSHLSISAEDGVWLYDGEFHLNGSRIQSCGSQIVDADYYSTIDDEAGGSATMRYGNNGQLYCYYYSDYYGYASNNITDGDYLAEATSNSWIDAPYHWWGKENPPASNFNADGSSTIDHSNPLSGPAKLAADILSVNFREAMRQWITGQREEAVPAFLEFVVNHEESPYASRSLVRLSKYYRRHSPETFISFSARLIRENSKLKFQAQELMVVTLFEAGAYSQAKVLAEKNLKESGNNNEFMLSTLFNMESRRGNIAGAQQQMDRWTELFPTSEIREKFERSFKSNISLGIVHPRDTKDVHLAGIDDILLENVNTDQAASIEKNAPLINFPNPFNPSTTIQYTVSEEGLVSLQIFDLLGRKVATLVDQRQAQGMYRVQWDASSYVSGIYIVKLTASNRILTHKLFLVK